MKIFKLLKYLSFFTCITLLVACTSTKTTLDITWDDKNYDAAQIQKILIIGLSDDEVVRRAFEEGMKKELLKTGVAVIAGINDLSDSDRKNLKALKKHFKNQGVDAVLVSRLVAVDHKSQYIPGRYDYMRTDSGFNGPYGSYGYYGNFYGYYYPSYREVYTPGYLKTTEIVRIETNVYETQQNKLIWSAVSKTFDPDSTTDTLNSLNKAISAKLVEDGFLK